jgi:chromosome segregation ATPase
MTTVLEQTKKKHHDHLVDLDEQRQKPQAKLVEKMAALAQLREKVAALHPRDPANELAIKKLNREIADLEREAAALQSQLAKIDGSAREIHEQVRALELPGDEDELRRHRDVFLESLDAARMALASYCACDREFKTKHGQEGVRRAGAIREELQDRERRLRALGWTEVDAVSATIGAFQVVAMLPPAGKQS